MNAALVSNAPSNPQRDLPYPTFDLAKGVKKLQEFGVRYFYTFSGRGQQAARSNPDLKLVATSTPLVRSCPDAEKTTWGCPTQWEIYEIAHSELVAPLKLQPAVATGIGQAQHKGWLDMGVTLYNHPELYPVPLTASGPKEWERVSVDIQKPKGNETYGEGTIITQPRQVALPPVLVTNIRSGQSSVAFHVDRVGVPVVVKVSYFPNWKASGAKGPYRVSPNFMVVVPTKNDVSLKYGYSKADYAGWLATFGGLAALVLFWRLERRRRQRAEQGDDTVLDGFGGFGDVGLSGGRLPDGMPGLLTFDEDDDLPPPTPARTTAGVTIPPDPIAPAADPAPGAEPGASEGASPPNGSNGRPVDELDERPDDEV
jgi:hypothetical protein